MNGFRGGEPLLILRLDSSDKTFELEAKTFDFSGIALLRASRAFNNFL